VYVLIGAVSWGTTHPERRATGLRPGSFKNFCSPKTFFNAFKPEQFLLMQFLFFPLALLPLRFTFYSINYNITKEPAMADELVKWSNSFSVNNETIDNQHKELVRITNEFYAGCKTNGILAKVYFLKTIQGAVQYIKTHFSTEEEIMKKADYPEFENHKKEHDAFVHEVFEQVKKFDQEENPDPSGFVKYLMNWVLNHIASSDKKFVPYIAKLNP
jgi:hemerythrin